LRADSAQEVHDLFQNAAQALSDRNTDGFEGAFDSSLPGYAKLRGDVAALLKASDTQSTIEWEKNEGDDQTRSVQLNWLLEITERGGAGAVTHRRARVQCQLRKKAGAWRMVSFAPADFFAPPQVDEAWTVLVTAALGLSEASGSDATSNGDADIPAANARKFMEAFDPAMPGYAPLRDRVLALEQGADIESSVDLVKNDGDDRVRTIEVDWSLNLVSRETSVTAVQRRQTVTCRLEKQGKKWRVTGLEPQELFAPMR
jgi:hypothetical protein